jgi:tetratricopeptide (TPR) repeat protein
MLSTILSGRYKLIQHLRSSEFTDIYLAQDEQFPNAPHCIAKQLKPRSTDPDTLEAARRLFETEAKVLSQLGSHDRIPRLLAYFEENQEFYLIEELIDGQTLDQELAQEQKFTETQVICLLQEVLKILEFVHEQHVIHRDIHPNHLIRRRADGKLMLTGFGAVKQVNTQVVTQPGQTSFVMAVGNPGYMPNEQRGGHPRFSSDIYALGMTAIQALTGVAPRDLPEDEQTGEVLWRSYAPQISPKFAAILDKMVRTHFRDRYQTVEEVLHDLHSSQQISKKRLILALSALGLVAAVGLTATALHVFSPRQPRIAAENCRPQSAAEFIACGQARLEAGQYNEALVDFAAAAERDPDLIEAWIGQGDALQALNRPDEAIAAYDRALHLDPNHVETLARKANTLLFSQQQYEEALAVFDQAVEIDATNPDLWSDRSIVLLNLQRNEEALASADKAIQIQSNHPYALANRGDALFALNRQDEAIAAYQQAQMAAPDYPYPFIRHGDVLRFLEQYADAIEPYDQAIAIDRRNSDAWAGKGYALNGLGQSTEALAAFDRAVEANPNSVYALSGRAALLDVLGRHEAALAATEQVLAIDPTYFDGWLTKSSTLLKLRRLDEAIEAADRAIELSPDNPIFQAEAWTRKANAVYESGRLEESLPVYQKVIELYPEGDVGWSNLSELLNRLKRYAEALEAANKALEIRETQSGWNQQGNALAGLRRYDEAIEAFDQVLSLNPDYHYAWVSKGNAFQQLGQYQEAVESYNRALAIQPIDRKLQDQTDQFSTLNQKGNALLQLQQYEQALEAFEQSVAIKPDFADAWFNQGRALTALQRYEEALAAYDQALALNPNFSEAKTRREQVQQQL